jgi:hypothetical protein
MMMQKTDKLTINEYLSTYSRKRNLDNAFITWCRKKNANNPQKSLDSWNNLLKEFLNEV